MFRSVVLLLFASFHSVAALTFSIELSEYRFTRQVVYDYQALLSEALNEPVAYIAGDAQADIIIANTALDSAQFHKSAMSVDSLRPVIEISLANRALPDSAPVALVQSPIYLKTPQPPLQVESRQTALDLMRRGRVSRILDDFSSKGAYLSADKRLLITTIAPEQKLHAWFKDVSTAERFGEYWRANRKAQVLESSETDGEGLDVFLLFKHFNPETKTFEQLPKEKQLVRWLFEEQLAERISIKGSNARSAFEAIENSDNSCVLNVRKNPQREAIAVFSPPTVDYLGPSFFARSGSELAVYLQSVETSSVSFAQLTARFPEAVIGYTARVSRSLPEAVLSSSMLVKVTPGDKESALDFDYVRSVFMLERGRVDAIVEYPGIFYAAAGQYDLQDAFSAIHMSQHNANTTAFIACSDSLFGRQVVDRIRALLASEAMRKTMLDFQMQGYSQKLKVEGLKLLNRHYTGQTSSE